VNDGKEKKTEIWGNLSFVSVLSCLRCETSMKILLDITFCASSLLYVP